MSKQAVCTLGLQNEASDEFRPRPGNVPLCKDEFNPKRKNVHAWSQFIHSVLLKRSIIRDTMCDRGERERFLFLSFWQTADLIFLWHQKTQV